jgi:hypothetical protein
MVNAVDPELESAWFQPLKLQCDLLVSKLASFQCNLCLCGEGALWTPSGAAFKLGRAPLAVFQPAPRGDGEGWMPLGTFFAVGADGDGGGSSKSSGLHPLAVAYAPAVSTWRSPTAAGGSGGGGGGMVMSTRLDVVNATLFTDAAARRAPLARLSLRRITADARLAPGTALELTAAAEASHFNPRTAAWEPIVEPWEVHARYGVKSSGGGGGGGGGASLRPGGYSLRVAGATPLRMVGRCKLNCMPDLSGLYLG